MMKLSEVSSRTIIRFMCLIAACSADLMCYVCKNCNTVDKNTPLLACNDDFFNHGGSTQASTVTTTMTTPLTTTEVPATTTSDIRTTESETSPPTQPRTTPEETTTTEQLTTEVTTDQSTMSTEAPMPTPPTVGPPETTTVMPTPPTEDVVLGVTKLLAVNDSPRELAQFASELQIRQRRAVIDTSVSFHCYTVKKTVNNTAQTERGCSRVLASQSVCGDLKQQSAPLELSYCDPCSMNACNAATSMLQTTLFSTLLIVLVAILLQYK
ncbi:hypothetical protein KR093_005457 [Drosophila rubida]|uniref:Integumentary mucin C.1 n=1 Tax=Drosophila rubida TaxID=30044 RepID=A0AAD4PMX0_9MUSC|nr:hypothetical protein KR093_005457 [Drosophila rubida]